MSTNNSQPDALTPDQQARQENGKKLTSYMLLGMAAFVIGVLVFGIVQMVLLIVNAQ